MSTIAPEKSQIKVDNPRIISVDFSDPPPPADGESMFRVIQSVLLRNLAVDNQVKNISLVAQMNFLAYDERTRVLTVQMPGGKQPTSRLVDWVEEIIDYNRLPIDRVGFSSPSSQHPIQTDSLSIVRGKDVKAIAPKFFVHPYLPDGSLSILFGDPGTSKSLLALWILARVSQGRDIFGCTMKAANVMMLSNEDDPGISIGRYLAAGGDVKRISFENFTGETFALEHIGRLKTTIREYKPKVLVIDSVMSHVGGKADVYRQNEVSALLSPLQAIAQQFQIVIIGLMHMNKQDAAKAIYRVGGSIGFVGSSRSAMFLDVKPDEPQARILCHVKANYSAHGSSQELTVMSDSNGIGRVCWVGRSEFRADDLLAKPDREGGGKKLKEAEELLNDVLVDGGIAASEIYARAEAIGIKPRTLERAKKKLGVESRRSDDNSQFVWRKREKGRKHDGEEEG